MKPRRKFNSGEAPEPGQTWRWPGNDELFYLVRRDHMSGQGEMWDAISFASGVMTHVFFNALDKRTPWTRVA